jgi:crotonobetainyl-CoA:carnitine CoA-transferase CaiB-like acyl-CoA transferase
MRALKAVGRADLTTDPRFAEPQERLRNAGLVDKVMADWIAEHTLDDAMTVFEEAEVAAAPVYDSAQLLEDPQLTARGTYLSMPDVDLGQMRIQGPVPRLSETPGRVNHLGPAIGSYNDDVYGELLGMSNKARAELHERGVI